MLLLKSAIGENIWARHGKISLHSVHWFLVELLRLENCVYNQFIFWGKKYVSVGCRIDYDAYISHQIYGKYVHYVHIVHMGLRMYSISNFYIYVKIELHLNMMNEPT